MCLWNRGNFFFLVVALTATETTCSRSPTEGYPLYFPRRTPPNNDEANEKVTEEARDMNSCPPGKRLANGICCTQDGRWLFMYAYEVWWRWLSKRYRFKVWILINKNVWEDLIAYFHFIRHEPHRKQRLQQFFFCCVCIRSRGNILWNHHLAMMEGINKQTQTDGRDLWSRGLRWAQVPWYTYQFS
jgi:hypothetical protein